MTKKLAIIGAGGHAKVVLDTALLMEKWDGFIFLDDFNNSQPQFMGHPLLGSTELLGQQITPNNYDIIIAIGDNNVRSKIYETAKKLRFQLPCIVHPTSSISKFAELSEGSVFFAQTTVNAGAKIGKCVIVNTCASVDHDCVLGDFAHISPGVRLGGNTSVGDFSWVGIGSCTRHESNIGSNCMIGAGAVVIKDVPDGETVIGNPAKALKRK